MLLCEDKDSFNHESYKADLSPNYKLENTVKCVNPLPTNDAYMRHELP